VEAKKEKDEDDLVEELTPTLHQESAGDLATSVQSVLLGGDLARPDGVFHTGCSCHGIFSSDTDAVEEERPDIADNPTVLGNAPGSCEHEQTEKHDRSILNQTPSATEPVTEDTHKNLTDNDTADLEVVDSCDPGRVACLALPAVLEASLEERLEVADGEEDVTLETETSARKNHIAEVESNGRQRIFLHHGPNGGQLLLCFDIVGVVDKADSLHDGQIGPVDTLFIVEIIRLEQVVEDLLLVLGHVGAVLCRGMIRDIMPMRRIGLNLRLVQGARNMKAEEVERSTHHAIVLGILFRHRCYRWEVEQIPKVSTVLPGMEDSKRSVGEERLRTEERSICF
jgi:hypothetical protein